MPRTHKRPRVAVIGTGLAGLSTAYLLKQSSATRTDGSPVDLDVHLFERSEALGMDTASISVKDHTGHYRVDVPMRSINGGSHSRVHKLYQRLRVPLVKSDFTYSFSRLARSPARTETSEPQSPSLPPTPPPEYREHATSRPPTPPHQHRAPTPAPAPAADHGEEVKAPRPLARPRAQTTAFLYEGASGLRFPPASLPSHLAAAPWRARAAYCADVATFTLAYLYLVALALVYCALGLAYPPRSPRPAPTSRAGRLWRRAAAALVPLRNVAGEPLLEWCARHGLPRRFSDEVLVPLMAAVATVGVTEARTMPVGEVLQYVSSTLLASHYVTHPSFGVRGIVAALAAPVPAAHVHLGVDITRLERLDGPSAGYRLHFRSSDSGAADDEEAALEFEHLVFATQADQAARLLATLEPARDSSSSASASADDDGGALAEALDALRAFTYVRTLVVTHTDERVLPPDARDRRDLNLAVSAPSPPVPECRDGHSDEWDESAGHLPATSVQTTHVLVSPRGGGSAPLLLLQTTNPLAPISPAHVLASTWFSRAFVTRASQRAVGALAALQGGGRTEGGLRGVWFAGSYLASGIPLLEGCVTSAETVARGVIEREGGKVQRWAV